MILSFTPSVAGQLILAIDPNVPAQVHQLANQLERNTQHILVNSSYYGLLFASLLGLISVLFGSFVLIRDYLRTESGRPYRQSDHTFDTRIAKANRAELRVVSSRIRAGQLSN